MRWFARQYGPKGVRVNAVCPGWVRTNLGAGAMDYLSDREGISFEEAYSLVTKHVPLRRPAEPEETAAVCAFLAGPDASIVTGHVMVADGGGDVVDLPTTEFDLTWLKGNQMVHKEVRKVALIAGGSGGVGAEIARRLSDDGLDVAVGYRSNRRTADEVVAGILAGGGGAQVVSCDLGTDAGAATAVAETMEAYGRIDVLVYAAGPYIPQKWFGAVTSDEMQNMLSDDAMACFRLLAAGLQSVRETAGTVITISTPAVRRHVKLDSLSSVPKAAIEAMVRAIAVEDARYDVRANAVQIASSRPACTTN